VSLDNPNGEGCMVTVIAILKICKSSIIHVIDRRRPYVKGERIEMFDFLKNQSIIHRNIFYEALRNRVGVPRSVIQK